LKKNAKERQRSGAVIFERGGFKDRLLPTGRRGSQTESLLERRPERYDGAKS